MNTLVKVLIGIAALALVWWAIASVGPSDAEEVAVAKAEAARWKSEAAKEAATVEALQVELTEARADAQRVDTIIRTVLRNPPPVRPQTPTGPALDSLGTDSLKTLLGRSVAYGDTVAAENVTLRAVLDTTARAFTRYRLAADSTIGAQARQIVAQRNQIAALQTIINVRECRILGFLKCPSRKVAAIGGMLVGAAAVGYGTRNR